MRSTSKALLLGLAAILAARLFAMAVMPLADTSEPRYAEIARLMAVTGDWVTPWFEPGVPFWGKPPLAFWAPALSIKLLGLSEFSLRLPAFAAMLGVLALVHAFAARRFGVSAARWAALVFATMLLPLASAGAVLTDPYLALGVTLSMTSFLLARRDGPRGGAMASSWVWRSACCPRAVGPGAGGGRRAALVAAARRTRAVARAALDRRHDPDAGAGPALVRDGRDPHARLPPVLHRGRAFPALRRPGLARRSVRHRAQAALWRHLAGLAAGDHALGTGGPVAVPAARPGRAAADPAGVAGARSLRAYLLLWGLAAPAFFTLSGNILWTYVLPSLPPLALALGAWMADHAPTQGWRARLPAALMLLTPLAALTLGALSLAQPERYKTEKQLVAQAFARMQPGEQLVFVGSRPFSARFYSQGAAGQLPMDAVAAAPACRGRRAPLPGGRKEPPAGLARHAGRLAAAAALRQPALRAAASRKRRRRGAR